MPTAGDALVVNSEEFWALAICAIRYCQGRETYMPGMIMEIIEKHLRHAPDSQLAILLQDIEEQKKLFCAGWSVYGDEKIDKPRWMKYEERVRVEIRRRENDC